MLLFLEQDMASRRKTFHDIDAAMKAPGASATTIAPRFAEAKESYFNSFERLASLVLGKYFDDDEMRRDYRDALRNCLTNFPDDFAVGSPYRK